MPSEPILLTTILMLSPHRLFGFLNVFSRQSLVPCPLVLAVCHNKNKAVPLHAMEALGGRGGIAPTHSQPRH
jgi:hypothetical protein